MYIRFIQSPIAFVVALLSSSTFSQVCVTAFVVGSKVLLHHCDNPVRPVFLANVLFVLQISFHVVSLELLAVLFLTLYFDIMYNILK